MRKSLLSIVICLLLNLQAVAQICWPFNWGIPFEGFYAGWNVGFNSYTYTLSDRDGYFEPLPVSFTLNDTGWALGGGLGYDWRCQCTLIGLLADFDWTNPHPLFEGSLPQEIAPVMEWFSTIRARGGLVLGDVLIYLTGGAVATRLKSHLIKNSLPSSYFSFHKYNWGWTSGFGAEFAFCDCWSLMTELLYFRLRTENISVTEGGINFPFKQYGDAWVGRVGVNYRFSICGF